MLFLNPSWRVTFFLTTGDQEVANSVFFEWNWLGFSVYYFYVRPCCGELHPSQGEPLKRIFILYAEITGKVTFILHKIKFN